MLKKIISGGQTGADQAALDVAIKFNIPHGGWIPKGRLTENGPLPITYRLFEMETGDYRDRTKKNIQDSHGTVIVSRGKLTGGSKLTKKHAKLINRPHIYIDLGNIEDFEASIFLKSFILENQIEVLNVAGPRISHDPGIYIDVKTVLEAALYLLFLDFRQDKVIARYLPDKRVKEKFPGTLTDAVELIYSDLSLKSRTYIARLNERDVPMVYFGFLEYVRRRVGFDSENKTLLDTCTHGSGPKAAPRRETVEDAVMVIIKALKRLLEKDHLLRVVK